MAAITSNGTGGGNWSAGASWTGAAVPVEGDTVIIQNGDTITIDQTITVGADTTTAAIEIASGGKLEVLHTVAADYILTLKGDFKISSGGTLEIGTVANPIPAARKFTIKLNYSAALAEGKYGLLNYGSMIIQGASKIVKTLLTGDLAATGTVWTIGDTTDWEVGDRLSIASTTVTWSEAEDKVIQTVDSGTQVTMTAGATNDHSGTSPTQAEVINLTRNVVVTSHTPASYRGYVICHLGSTSNVDYVEFYMIGYNATYKHGIEIRTTAADATNFAYCSVWGLAASNYPFYLYYAENVVIDNCVIYNTDEQNYLFRGTSNTITNNIVMKINDYGFDAYLFLLSTIENNTATSCKWPGFYIRGSTTFQSFSDNTAHSDGGGSGFNLNTISDQTFSNLISYRNDSKGIYMKYANNLSFDNFIAFGNTTNNIYGEYSGVLKFTDIKLNGDTTFTTSIGIYYVYNVGGTIQVIDSELGVVSGIKTAHTIADIYTHSFYYIQYLLKNTKLSSTTKVGNIENAIVGSYVQCQDLDQVQYADKAWYKYGIAIRDGTTYKSGSYSTRFDYLWAADDWLEYDLYVPVKDGEQITVSVWLRKNASYTSANRPKIVLSGMGITEDEAQMTDVTDTWERVTVQGTPTRTGTAKLTIKTYLTNAGASAWMDMVKTDILSGVLNTIEGDFWVDGHMASMLMDTGSITAAEFWKTLTADVAETGSFANLLKDYLNATISGRAPANEYDTEMAYIPSNLGDVPTAAELIAAHGSGDWTSSDVSALATAIELAKVDKKIDRNFVVKI